MGRPEGVSGERALQSKLRPLDVAVSSKKSPNITHLTFKGFGVIKGHI